MSKLNSNLSVVRLTATGITVVVTSGLLLSVTPQIAQAYASVTDPGGQLKVLRDAFRNGSAVPEVDKNSLIKIVQPYCDSHRTRDGNSC